MKYRLYFLQIVKEYERAVILRLGKMTSRKAKGPGLFFILPCIDKVSVVDLRTVTFDIPPQKVWPRPMGAGRIFLLAR